MWKYKEVTRDEFEWRKDLVDEVLFHKKPFIVIEWAGEEQGVIDNIMEDTSPFPYDLSDEEIETEIRLLFDEDK